MRGIGSRALCVAAALPAICAVQQAWAARPYVTDDPGTTERGKFELEVAADYWNNTAGGGIVFKHGFTDRAELDIPIGYQRLPGDERGIWSPQAYLKFAIVPDLFTATFTATFGHPSYDVNLIVSKSFGVFRLTGNAGGSLNGGMDDADLTYSLSGIFTIKRFETGVEAAGTQEGVDWWQVGAKFFFTEWLSLDAGVGGDFSRTIQMKATTGLWFAFPVSKPGKQDQAKSDGDKADRQTQEPHDQGKGE